MMPGVDLPIGTANHDGVKCRIRSTTPFLCGGIICVVGSVFSGIVAIDSLVTGSK